VTLSIGCQLPLNKPLLDTPRIQRPTTPVINLIKPTVSDSALESVTPGGNGRALYTKACETLPGIDDGGVIAQLLIAGDSEYDTDSTPTKCEITVMIESEVGRRTAIGASAARRPRFEAEFDAIAVDIGIYVAFGSTHIGNGGHRVGLDAEVGRRSRGQGFHGRYRGEGGGEIDLEHAPTGLDELLTGGRGR